MMHLMESLFDIAYLGLVVTLGIRLLFEKNKSAKRYGVMAILLGAGDSFHLVPRVVSHLTPGGFDRYVAALSWGELVTSITMTVFYLLFYFYYKDISGEDDKFKDKIAYLLCALRVIFTLLPQNNWGTEGSYLFSIIRNVPFTILGALLILWTWKNKDKNGLRNMNYLILASFLFYLPVVVGARFVPILGILMIPKTIAYVLLVVLGYRYFIGKFSPDNLVKHSGALLIMGLVGGVFYREFVKVFKWFNPTTLSIVHVHMLVLGFAVTILFYLLTRNVKENVDIKGPVYIYMTGLAWTVTTFLVRGIYTITSEGQVLFPDAALSGIAGIGHLLVGLGLVLVVKRIAGGLNLEGRAKRARS